MAEIKTGSGFMEANRQMEEAARDGQAARTAGDTQAEGEAETRFANAQQASRTYVAENYVGGPA
ncbi:hypothetical protein AB0465_18430 [Streptomyces griseoviridis]|uniref:hypothetical protein n=1 Tax=Streptomyces griseoviridis TaxID=45398 RepID=UPI00344F82DD